MSSLSEEKDSETEKNRADISRRDFLKVAMTLSGLMAFGGVATVLKAISNPEPGASSSLTFPRVKVADTSISANSVIYFNYPLDSEPNFLVKLGQRAPGGVGHDQDIVAFSQVCQHLGCESIIYYPQSSQSSSGGPVAYCTCHGSVFDLLQSAKVVAGPSPRPLPQVELEVDSSGNIFARRMGPPTIFGHNTGSNDVSADLRGGSLVS